MESQFSMSEAVIKTQKLISAQENALRRALRHNETLSALDSRVGFFRLLTVVIVLAALVGAAGNWDPVLRLGGWAGFVGFLLLGSLFHKKLQAKAQFWKSSVQSFELGLARMRRDSKVFIEGLAPWHKEIADNGPRGHVYATDLDVGSHVFDLLDTCATKEGSAKLYHLLLTAGLQELPREERVSRKNRAAFLAKKGTLLRRMEALRLNEDYIGEYLRNQDDVKKSVEHSSENADEGSVNLAVGIGFAILSFVAWGYFLIPALRTFFENANGEQLFTSVFKYLVVPLVGVGIYGNVVKAAGRVGRRTKVLMEVLKHMRNLDPQGKIFAFKSLTSNAESSIRQLNFGVDLITLRGNPIFWLALHVLLPFDSIVCLFLLLKLRKVSSEIDQWWDEAIEFDVDVAIARMARENPTFRFVSEQEEAKATAQRFLANDLGHPLLSAQSRINNSFDFSIDSPLVLLTGSNMAGKSTFLRTLGINMLFFNMGAPVCAAYFAVLPHRLLCAIRVDDSLTDGTSYFYAEVKRLKLILQTLQTGEKSLFLIDEIFRGTNNRERFLGSWHILQALLQQKSFGVVSTHDLALADLAAQDVRLRNMHFREHVQEGSLIFDYKLREGKCPTTNALHIMRDAGLPIPQDAGADLPTVGTL
jgi:hypothetical protein